MIENGMVIEAAACNYGYGWDDPFRAQPDDYCADAYYDEDDLDEDDYYEMEF